MSDKTRAIISMINCVLLIAFFVWIHYSLKELEPRAPHYQHHKIIK